MDAQRVQGDGLTIAELVRRSYTTATEKGWWEEARTFPEALALMHSELSEALEEYRNGHGPAYYVEGKPEGQLVELADVVIRIADWLWAPQMGSRRRDPAEVGVQRNPSAPAWGQAAVKPYYEHGGVTIYHGDCRDLIPALSADVVLTDPPYGAGIDYGAGTDDTLGASGNLLIDVLRIVVPRTKRTLTTVGMFEIEKRLYREFPPRWRLCWRKGITSRPSPVGFTDWEPVFVYGDDIHRHAHDLFTVQPQKMGSYGHPCPKPIGYAAWILSRFSDPGDVVIDPFMGSGTTVRAAKDRGNRAIGIDIEERYCEIAARRLSQEVLPL